MTYDKKAAVQAAKEEKAKMEEKIQETIQSWTENPEALAEFFRFSGEFSYQYSFRNTILIQQQNRGATFCQSFDAWKKAGYSVLKGMHGMLIYVPVQATMLEVDGNWIPLSEASEKQRADYKAGKIPYHTRLHYRIGKTFDIAQTNFPPEKYPELLSRGIPSDLHKYCVMAIREYIEEEMKIPVWIESEHPEEIENEKMQYEIQGASLYGLYRPKDTQKEIRIAKSLQDTAVLSTLAHEMGHAAAEHSVKENTHKIEFEADAFCIMLQSHLGLPVSESRKEHINYHYHLWKAAEKENFKPEDSIDKIFHIYKKHVVGIDQKLEKYLPEGVTPHHLEQKKIQANAEAFSSQTEKKRKKKLYRR